MSRGYPTNAARAASLAGRQILAPKSPFPRVAARVYLPHGHAKDLRQGEKMNLLRNVLVVIAATGAIGSAQAQNTFDLGTLDPTVKTRTDIFGAVAFADIFNFTVDASNSTVSSSTIALGH